MRKEQLKKKKSNVDTIEDANCCNYLKIVSHYNDNGYTVVSLNNNNIKKLYRLHKLLAQTFIPNPDNLPFVLHINRDKDDNRIENLKWVSKKDYYPPN